MLDNIKNKTNWYNPVEAINSGIAYAGILAKLKKNEIFGDKEFKNEYKDLSIEDKILVDQAKQNLQLQGFG